MNVVALLIQYLTKPNDVSTRDMGGSGQFLPFTAISLSSAYVISWVLLYPTPLLCGLASTRTATKYL